VIEPGDVGRLIQAEREWTERKDTDLAEYWPRQECWDAYMMRANGGVNVGWGYTHWWKMFNPRRSMAAGCAGASAGGFSAVSTESEYVLLLGYL